MSTADDILNQAMQLPTDDRANLARQLLLSLEPGDFDDDAEAAWGIEIDARLAAMDNGTSAPSPWPEALVRIRQAMHASRNDPP